MFMVLINNLWVDTYDTLREAKTEAHRLREETGYVSTLAAVYQMRFWGPKLMWMEG